MTKPILDTDQRWLLLHMGTWQIVDALCSPEGVSRLMQSWWGSTAGRAADLNGSPKWLETSGWETSGSVITARSRKVPAVKIKAAELKRFAASLPADIKAELLECRKASTENAVLMGRFCHCGRDHDKSYPYEKDRICPPTREQENQARADYWRIRALEHVVLAKALGLNGRSHIESDQLELDLGEAS